jgi:hypothetical protein
MKHIDTNKQWQTYEARIQDAVFEWPCPIPEDIKEAEYKCREFLDKVFTEYTVEDFYLQAAKKQ